MRDNGRTFGLTGGGDGTTTVLPPLLMNDVADTEAYTMGGAVNRGRQCGRSTKMNLASGGEATVDRYNRGPGFPPFVGCCIAAHQHVAHDAPEQHVEGRGGRDQGVAPKAVCASQTLRY